MRKLLPYLLVLFTFIAITSCSSEEKEEVIVDPVNASSSITTKALDSIRNELQKAIPAVPQDLYKKAIAMHLQFVDAYPNDPFAATALDYAQGYYEQMQDFRSSVQYIDRILKEYPEYPNKQVLMFSKATHLDFLRDTVAAKKAYEDYLNTFKDISKEERSEVEELIKLVPYSMEERIKMNSGK